MINKIKILSLLICFILLFQFCARNTSIEKRQEPEYVGSDKCLSCHANETMKFKTSNHFHALDSLSPLNVKADFNNTYFIHFGDTTNFFMRDKNYFVRTKDLTGIIKEFKITYTIGWFPLQQYLVSFSDGRIQTLPFCWDTRTKAQGGQRWFHIYDRENILPDDELFWMNINMNWNNMCADCHTTDYKKNYDIATNTFHSQWKEDRVSCESCHGPASEHIKWTNDKKTADTFKGFEINLAAKKVNWVMNNEKGIAYPDKLIKNDQLIETCARCHSRAVRLSDDYHHGRPLLNTHIPSNISTDNYYIDGQIRNEDYEYGSFLQSKMYSAGVTCINCHDPHTSKLKAPGNQVCATCHATSKFDTPLHTKHNVNSSGSQCINCHMPGTNYMVIDDRRDHSIRIPRPDLSEKLQTPNACNKCHTDKSVKWAVENFSKWYGDKISKQKTYGELLHDISQTSTEGEQSYHQLLTENYPDIIKATAIAQNNTYYLPRNIDQLKKYLSNNDPNLRLNALKSTSGLNVEILKSSVIPLLYDSIMTVRTEALKILAPFNKQLNDQDKKRFDLVLFECLTLERNMSDRPEGYLNQGIILASIGGRFDDAEKIYMLGLSRHPQFINYYVNIADLYRASGQELKAKEFLDKGLVLQPKNASLHFSLGLWYIRNGDKTTALAEIGNAYLLNPADSYYIYVYSLFLNESGNTKKAKTILNNYISRYGKEHLISEALQTIEDSELK